MKHFFALPAVLRPALLLAAASQHTFSVQDDLLAFPQYDVQFSDDYVTEQFVEAQLRNKISHAGEIKADSSHVDRYQHDPDNEADEEDMPKMEYETMRLDGFQHLCRIPQITKAERIEHDQNDTLSKADEEKELARASDRGWELLAGMQGNCVYYISGWWSYRFCYGQGVKQFHQLPPSRGVPIYPPVEDPSVYGYELGLYGEKKAVDDDEPVKAREPAESDTSALDASKGVKRQKGTVNTSGELVQRGESRYLVQRLEGGTRCDLTGRDRRIEVQVRCCSPCKKHVCHLLTPRSQFHCNPMSSDKISLIEETATCAYLMIVQTPRLCNDVAFQPPQKDAPNTILCNPILAAHEIEEYERDMKALKSADRDAQVWAAQADDAAATLAGDEEFAFPHPVEIVGDIIVGGHALIPEGQRIEKSALLGGTGKETYVDTVASSAGGTLPEVELKKLGLGDADAVKVLRKKIEKIAKGKGWKLDVVDTPTGREYRGIIEDDPEEKKKEEEREGEEGVKGENQGKKKQEKNHQEKQEKEDGKKGQGSEEEYFREEL